MANNGYTMSSATIGRFYAEEMCAKADVRLDMLDSHVKECGVKDLDKVEVNDKTLVDHLSSVSEDTPERREYQARTRSVRIFFINTHKYHTQRHRRRQQLSPT